MFALRHPPVPDPRFVVDDFEPAYLALHRAGRLYQRVAAARAELADCCACPRDCHVNRMRDERKVCNTGRYAVVTSAFAHFGEEDCLRGFNGSGTIFFGWCNLRCVFCQNWEISQRDAGEEMDADRIADRMLDLQERGCHNINFVTPEHVAPQIVEAVAAAVPRGLRLPIVYNTSAYDSITSLKLMDGIVDIYMPDFKFWHRDSSRQYVKAKDYRERACDAIVEMHRQVGPLVTGRDGLARRGVLLRHLVMPGQLEESKAIFQWVARVLSRDTYINIMDQYRPDYEAPDKTKYQNINRRPDSAELRSVRERARAAGLWRFDERW